MVGMRFFADAAPAAESSALGPIEFQRGDHLVLIGNTLGERMQHDGWFETLLHRRFPKHELVVRNLCFSADAVTRWFGDEPPARLHNAEDQVSEGVTTRLRSADFGSSDQWLHSQQADVVFAFFGFNESFAGEKGIERFKKALTRFVKHTLSQQYHEKRNPQLVLFSPIAHENLHDRNLPDGQENNRRLKLYTEAMAEVAAQCHVRFVNLFEPSGRFYETSEKPLTINGIHLTSEGNRQLAVAMDEALSDKRAEAIDWTQLEKLREAVLDKNFYWFHRYRTTDGYNVFGGRSHLKFKPGITNRVVMQREMAMLDVMTANRDQRIWAVARGGDLQVDDSNLPEVIPVPTNIPGPGPHGEYTFLTGEGAIEKMTLGQGMKINLFASEEMFPELANPVQMAWDTKGRLWVAVWPTYPHWNPREPMNDKLLILEDTDGDNRADRCTVFADGLSNPTGFEFYGDGVMIAQVPDIDFLQDTDGDDRADVRRRVLHGIGSADTHHSANSFVLSPGGALFFQEGTFHRTQTETPYGPVRNVDACAWRFEPRTWRFERYIPFNFANPHGHVFDRWGQDIITDGTGAQPYHGTLFSGHLDYPWKHLRPPQLYQQRTRPCPGTEILSSRHFPAANQGNLLVANVIGFRGILQYRLEDSDSSLKGIEVEPIVQSSDLNFRPSDIEMGPDGAIYFLDWHNQIIGHMQHHIRDPNRDITHGRIYRITYPARPLLQVKQIAGQPIETLLELLKQPEDRVRYRAKIELSARNTRDVMAALDKWVDQLDKNDPNFAHHLLEALWVHQYHNVVDAQLLGRVLRSEDFHARAAATRVLGYWQDRLDQPLALLRASANDAHPRVRLEAVRACSFIRNAQAAEVAVESLRHPMDKYLKYTLGETLRQLERFYLPVLMAGQPLAGDNPAGLERLLDEFDAATLVKLAKTEPVCVAILLRANVAETDRRAALRALAEQKQTDELTELLAVIDLADGSDQADMEGVLSDLARLLTNRDAATLSAKRAALVRLATSARRPIVRQVGFVALWAADGAVDAAWKLAVQSSAQLLDFLRAAPLVADNQLREPLYQRVAPLLDGLPAGLTADAQSAANIRRAVINALTYLPGHDAETFRKLASFYQKGIERAAAVAALARLRKDRLAPEELLRLAQSMVAHVQEVPAAQRTTPVMLATIQLGKNLARLLPPEQAKPIRKVLRDLGVEMISIRPVPRMMRYDRSEIAVEAGKPVEIVFENIDVMQHNLVIAEPGAFDAVVAASLQLQKNPNQALAQGFVPKAPQVLWATKLLQAGETAKLKFTAPSEPGKYPYVCTYPGHAKSMNGIMHVVPDLDAFLASYDLPEPETSLAVRTHVVQDYKYEDLVASLHWAPGSRSFEAGKKLFTEMACSKCHKIDGPGDLVGPNLAREDLKHTREEMLRSIVEPSQKIDKKYLSWMFFAGGKPYSGMILEETADYYLINEKPGEQCEPTKILKDDLDEAPRPSPISVMPAKVLNTMTISEIQDLLAYVHAKGDPANASFADAGSKPSDDSQPWVVYAGGSGPGAGKHVVLISGDEEYRSEEALPQLGRILAKRHGFRATVLFAIDKKDGTINPVERGNIPGLAALDDADLMVIFTRFRDLPDEQMKHIVDYVQSGRPVIGLRTATHAFRIKPGKTYSKYSWDYQGDDYLQGFGRQVLGETWIRHHGHHGHESTRGVIAPGMQNHPILRGIQSGDIWGPTDVYGVRLPLPGDCQPLVLGQVLTGMQPTDPPVAGEKNNPMLPVAWTKTDPSAQGKRARVFTTTMGASQDFSSAGLRRLFVNACYWCLGLEDKISDKTNVDLVGPYHPTPFGFGKHRTGIRPQQLKLP